MFRFSRLHAIVNYMVGFSFLLYREVSVRSHVCIITLALFTLIPARSYASDAESPWSPPRVLVAGIKNSLTLKDTPANTPSYTLDITKNGKNIANYNGTLPAVIEGVVLPSSGTYSVTVTVDDQVWTSEVRAIPGLVTILPPLIAILMALIFRQVVIALFSGVWLGAFFLLDHNPLRSFFYVIDHYVVDSLAGPDGWSHVQIAIFTLLLGGMVGIFSRIGGTQGVVDLISGIATNARRGQLATWLMGLAIFFDDYTNTLVVGNTMRPLTDRLKISREKLSYIVDSTAAPVACIAVITSWIGFEISLLKDAFDATGLERNPFTTFVASLQYSFYPLLTLLFGLLIAAMSRDFGPMLRAERRARHKGQVLGDGAVPLTQMEEEISTSAPTPRWYNAAIPVVVVVLGTFVGLLVTGRSSLIESGTTSYTAMDMIRSSDSFNALLWSSLSGCVVAIGLGLAQRLAALLDIMNAWTAGVRSMSAALIILVLAWCIGKVCTDLNTAGYLVHTVSGLIKPGLLPTIIFLIAAAISFSTGTSWGTMTILTPITVPLVISIGHVNAVAPDTHEGILLASISAILAGSVFGDHCSPISDTTIMSSMASGADHVDHVRTQLPYAVTVAIISILVGYLPSGFNVPSVVSLVAGAAACVAVIRLIGKKDDSAQELVP